MYLHLLYWTTTINLGIQHLVFSLFMAVTILLFDVIWNGTQFFIDGEKIFLLLFWNLGHLKFAYLQI